jgi:hypothetical protein
MKVKTSELTDKLLDWAVTKCEVSARGVHADYLMPRVFENMHDQHDFNYSTNWSQGGPIIEREKLHVWWDYPYTDDEGNKYGDHWCAEGGSEDDNIVIVYGTGPTPLIAAMRCYVTGKLGEEIDMPEELG